MKHILNAFDAKLLMYTRISGFLFVVALAVFSVGCSKGPAANEGASKPASAGNTNKEDQAAALTPLVQPNLRGDLERASLAVSMALDAVKLSKRQEAVSHLQAASKEVEAALGRQPRLREELEALRSAIERAIPAVENRGKEAAAAVDELQTRIGAIKVNTPRQ